MERGNSGRVVHQSDTPLVRERDRAPTKPEVTEPVERESRFVADYGVVAALGLISSGTRSGLLFGVGVHGGWGGRFTPGFGMEGLIDMHLLGGPGGVLINIAAAPGLRFGHRSHFVLGLGPSLAFVNTIAGLQTFIEGTLTLRGVILFGDGGFGLHLDGSVVFDQSGALFMFGIGLGGSSV
jgi:hypothetical protein